MKFLAYFCSGWSAGAGVALTIDGKYESATWALCCSGWAVVALVQIYRAEKAKA